MPAHIFIIDTHNNPYTIKKSDIRRVEAVVKSTNPLRRKPDFKDQSVINFVGVKNTPIRIDGTVAEFYQKHLSK